MTKKERELRQQLATLKAEARQLADEGKMDEARAKVGEANAVNSQIELLRSLDDLDAGGNQVPSGQENDEQEEEKQYRSVFFKAFRRQRLSAEERDLLEKRVMTESVDADGGYAVPKDVQTRINEFKRSLPDLTRLINVEPVNTNSGSRTFELTGDITPLTDVTQEGVDDIAEMDGPKLTTVLYNIKKYAGWIPVSNDLLKDSDQAIMNWLTRWIGRKSVVTRNSLILAIAAALAKIDIADWKGLKKIINVSLDPMLSLGATILTNQDGFQLMDTWEDGQGKPLLKPDITNPSSYMFAGKPIVVVPNKVLKTIGDTTKKAPCIVGSLPDLITMFERQGYQIDSTNVGGNSFRKDNTEIRVIEREDVKKVDGDAAIYGYLDVTAI